MILTALYAMYAVLVRIILQNSTAAALMYACLAH